LLIAVGAAAAQPAPAPYSLPFLLRPAVAANVVRLDSTLALYEDAAGRAATTFVESLSASYKTSSRLALVFRLSLVHDDPPAAPGPGTAISNPLLGVGYLKPLGASGRLALFGASAIPVGSGSGERPSASAASAIAAGIPARSAMDNALFAVNYWTVIGGVSAAHVTSALTLQAEATLLQLFRVRGPESQDDARTNLTAGVHVGRFVGARTSLGAELRLQRWMSDAAPVRRVPSARETLTFAVGPRFHFKLAQRMLRPGLSWTWTLDDPLKAQRYGMLQLDVPVAF